MTTKGGSKSQNIPQGKGIGVVLEPSLYDKLEKLAVKGGMSIAQIVRQCIIMSLPEIQKILEQLPSFKEENK